MKLMRLVDVLAVLQARARSVDHVSLKRLRGCASLAAHNSQAPRQCIIWSTGKPLFDLHTFISLSSTQPTLEIMVGLAAPFCAICEMSFDKGAVLAERTEDTLDGDGQPVERTEKQMAEFNPGLLSLDMLKVSVGSLWDTSRTSLID